LAAIEAVKGANDDEQIGVDIIKRAVEGPLRSLAANAGVEGSLIVQEVKKRKGNEGYNVATGEYEDLVKAGVVDPKKVTRSALAERGQHRRPVAHDRMPHHRRS
jgi:chaperonin GroEL